MAEHYRLADFLLFSARVYDRLFLRHFDAFGVITVVLCLAAMLAMGALLWRGALPGRPVLALLGGIWLWVAASFVWWLYLPINWAMQGWLPLFGLQALLLWGVAWRAPSTITPAQPATVVPAATLLLGGLVLWPALTAAHGWRGAALFGAAPDPTALVSLGLLLFLQRRARWLLLPIPTLWCVFSGMTLLAMERDAAAAALLAAPVLALIACLYADRSARLSAAGR